MHAAALLVSSPFQFVNCYGAGGQAVVCHTPHVLAGIGVDHGEVSENTVRAAQIGRRRRYDRIMR